MSLQKQFAEFGDALINACLSNIERVPEIVGQERAYAFAVYTTEGFEGFGSAIATEESFSRRPKFPGGIAPETLEMLEDHPDLLAKVDLATDVSDYLRVTADEWEFLGLGDDDFDKVNALTESIHRRTESRDWNLTKSDFLRQILISLRRVKDSHPFSHPVFSSDVLLTLQWSDIGTNEPELLNIASALNSSSWIEILQKEWGGRK